jgi:hypothetical protein
MNSTFSTSIFCSDNQLLITTSFIKKKKSLILFWHRLDLMKIYFKFLNNSFENLILYLENGKKNKGPKKNKIKLWIIQWSCVNNIKPQTSRISLKLFHFHKTLWFNFVSETRDLFNSLKLINEWNMLSILTQKQELELIFLNLR